VIEAGSGLEAIRRLQQEAPDLVVLDLGLPDLDGLEVIGRMRQIASVPIVVLSIRSDEKGKVAALEIGADDYVTKPFGMEELIARIRTALRHRYQAQGQAPVYRAGALMVDLVHRRVQVDGTDIRLSAKEFDLLRHFVVHAGKVLTHDFVLREVWGPAHTGDIAYLRVYVRLLRQKLEPDPGQPRYLLTETGVGYRLQPPD
jgi:two-component system KDP operon response regulator KdpE